MKLKSGVVGMAVVAAMLSGRSDDAPEEIDVRNPFQRGENVMKVFRNTVFGVMLVFASSTFAAQGRWTEGFGQGNLEYFIDQDGLRLYVACPTQEGSAEQPSGVMLTQLGSGRDVGKFTLEVNGVSYDGPFNANSRVGENNFLSLLENLRKTDAVVKAPGKTVRFPKSNAAKVLPIYGKKFSCNLSG